MAIHVFANASADIRRLNPHLFDRAVSHARPQSYKKAALDAPVSGKKKSARRVTVRFTLYRLQLLDVDSKPASCKDLLDGLQLAGLITDDDEKHIKLKVEQVMVHHRRDEQTVIDLEYPPGLEEMPPSVA